jgi:hypothetical protein
MATSLRPATQMGGRGARTGRGAIDTLSSVAYFPA